MTTLGTPEKVFPAAAPGSTGPTGSPGSSGKAGAFLRRNRTALLIGGAGAAVFAGLLASRGSSSTDATGTGDAVDPTDPGGYTLDTTATDLYDNLQPELENIGDQISNLTDVLTPGRPRPRPPRPGTSTGPHRPHHSPRPHRKRHRPAAKPEGERTGRAHYITQQGDKLGEIARQHKVRGGAGRLYAVNRRVIEAAARAHGHKSSRAGRLLFPGTRLVIP